MEAIRRHLAVWAASARYSVARQLMFRTDFLVWTLTDLVWIAVNLLSIEVLYAHTTGIAGWSKPEMLVLLGSALLQQRLFMSLFLTGFFELGRNVRSGQFDFHLAQPGNVLFLVATRRLELDGLPNAGVAIGIVAYGLAELGRSPGPAEIAAYTVATGLGLIIHFGVMATLASAVFWVIKSEGMENGYFTLFEFGRLPREAYKGASHLVFGTFLPVVVASHVPASTVARGLDPAGLGGLALAAALSLATAIFVFHRGLRQYASASS